MTLMETDYSICQTYNYLVAVLADIHFRKIEEIMSILQRRKPDMILIPGDLVDGVAIAKTKNHKQYLDEAINLLNKFSSIAPTYFSIGNHEKQFYPDEIEVLSKSNAEVLKERVVNIRGDIYIAGLTSAHNYYDNHVSNDVLDINFIDKLEKIQGFKILLSHHPEYYKTYLKCKNINLIISGHAHGGQIRVFNRGVYAPGQGLLPKYTSGIYDNKLVVSRGVAGTELFPRINNKPEIVFLHI